MLLTDDNNEIFQLANTLVNESNRSIFLTGKAGTGKTTFLKYIRHNCLKQIAVTAPTGVAAINAGGATIHSFFQLPISPFIPEAKGVMENKDVVNKHSLIGRMRLNIEKRKVLQQLELLIIDEISMVRCDMMDAIDTVLRYFRNRNSEPFGGVQLLLIGDMYQLPPIMPDEEWGLLSHFYKSVYFFESLVMQQFPPLYIEFNKIYRQSDEGFIHLLNEVRHNNISDESRQLLNSRYDPWFELNNNDGYIFLTTHNYKSDNTNADELLKLKGRQYSFKAEITGDFNEKAYPADEVLELKIGSQVMFLRNDKEKIKRYFNGKIGLVTKIDENVIFVRCKTPAGYNENEENEIEVHKETWKNIRYSIDKQTQQLKEEVIGEFTQFPLRLAWAITIHKSQGLTFEKAVIDAGNAFAPGQVYVALSRCTTLNGIVLKSLLSQNGLNTDKRILEFSEKNTEAGLLQQELHLVKKNYQQEILLTLFDFSDIIKQFEELYKTVIDNAAAFNTELPAWLTELESKIQALNNVAVKFKPQLLKYFEENILPEQNDKLQQRLVAGALYFIQQTTELNAFLVLSPASTDSKMHAKAYNDLLKELFIFVAMKSHLLQSCSQYFTVTTYFNQKKNFITPGFYVNAYATASETKTKSPHPVLHKQLRELRNKICEEKNLSVFYVANSETIDEMAKYLPQNSDEIVKLKGFGQAKAKQYGERFLKIIRDYCEANNLSSSVHEIALKKDKKKKANDNKEDSKTASYKLHKEGKSIAEIAKTRNLAMSTIESHLTYFIRCGMISINELVQTEKLIMIEPLLQSVNENSIVPVKQKLGDTVSFNEIRMVLAAKEWEKLKEGFQ